MDYQINTDETVHQDVVEAAVWGTFEQMEDHARMNRMLMEAIRGFYTRNSKLPPSRIKALLTREAWFSADQAVTAGLADSVIHGYAIDTE